MKKTTLALGMHDKLFKRARTMYQIEHCICDLLMTKGFLRIIISLIKMEILLAYVLILPVKSGA